MLLHETRITARALGAMLLFSAGVGCSPAPVPVGDGGADGATSLPDASSPGDASSDGGGGGTMDCATIAQRTCARVQSCTPLVFERAYESMALCVSAVTQSCALNTASPLPQDNGVVDAAACEAALDSCPAYLNSLPSAGGSTVPAACEHRRGTRSSAMSGMGRSCGADFMCIAGEYCYGVTQAPVCQNGSCSTPDRLMTGFNTCNMAPRDPCDVNNNQRCTRVFDMAQANRISTDANGSRYTCRQVTLGGVGASCAATTNSQCMPGLVCTAGFTCQPLLGMGMSCDGPAADQCDTRLGLSCQTVPNSTSKTCRPTPFARIGAQCGSVTEGGVTEMRQCAAAVAFCNGATPTVCEALKGMGDPCTTSPRDNCRAPFSCRSGTCQAPAAPMCS
jgi:hypothetical protein